MNLKKKLASDNGKYNQDAKSKGNKFIRKAIISGAVVGGIVGLGITSYDKEFNKVGKRYIDDVVKSGSHLTTLVKDSSRMNNPEYIFAAYTKRDIDLYRSRFGTFVRENDGNRQKDFKESVRSILGKDINIASEDSSTKEFIKLYKTSKDFRDSIHNSPDKSKMHHNVKKFAMGADCLQKAKSENRDMTDNELKKFYKFFNYMIPYDGSQFDKKDKKWKLSDKAGAKSIAESRKIFFDYMKKQNYDAIFDVNDGMYGGYKSQNPIIFFNFDKVVRQEVRKLSAKDINRSRVNDVIMNFNVVEFFRRYGIKY